MDAGKCLSEIDAPVRDPQFVKRNPTCDGYIDLAMAGMRPCRELVASATATGTTAAKDSDFVFLLERLGPPPKIIWLRCGNTSEAALKKILSSALSEAMRLLEAGDDLVEIGNL